MHQKKSYVYLIPLILLILIISALISSCEKETIDFSSSFVDNNTTNINLVDTSTIKMSTVYVDSFATSDPKTLFAGNYSDPQFGKINAESYMQVGLPASLSTTPFPNGSVFDSIEVIFKLNKNYYGDTTVPYTIEVHQLNEDLPYPSTQSASYNIDSRTYNSMPLGSKQLLVSPHVTDTISVRLSQAFGQDLFDKLNTNALEIQNVTQFLNYFKGMAFTGAASNNLVLGFQDSVILRLHYLRPGPITEDVPVDFNITNPNYSFNHITDDRTGTPLAALGNNNPQIPSSQTGNFAFSQYITGSMTKIQFPNLLSLQNLPGFVKIINAQLLVKPVFNSYSPIYQLPPQLGLSVTDQYNLPGTYLSLISSYGTPVSQDGSLFIDYLYGTGTVYTYDITSYIQSQIAITQNNQNGLLLIPLNDSLTFNRVIVDNSNNPITKTQLKVYYVSSQ